VARMLFFPRAIGNLLMKTVNGQIEVNIIQSRRKIHKLVLPVDS
jgi:hypothetical protein